MGKKRIHGNIYSAVDLTTTNTTSRPVSAPAISTSTANNSIDRSKEASVINADVTLSLRKNRSGEDKGKNKKAQIQISTFCKLLFRALQRTKRTMRAAVDKQLKQLYREDAAQRDDQPAFVMLALR